MTPDIETRRSHGILWAPSQDPAPSEGRPTTEPTAPRRPSRPTRAPVLPVASRQELGFFGAHGPLFYFAGILSVAVLGTFLFFAAPPDVTFKPLSDDEWTALEQSAPVPSPAAVPTPIILRVDSEPTDALVYVDGVFTGLTPHRTDALASGTHTVTIRKSGYVPRDTLLLLEAGGASAVTLALVPTTADPSTAEPEPIVPPVEADTPPPLPVPASGSVQIVTSPAGAAVRIDGRRVGGSPLLRDLAPGAHTITLFLRGHASHTLQVVIAPGKRATVRADLVPLTGTLSMIVRPWGSLYVDGTLYASDSDLRHDLVVPVGTHLVRAVHPVLGTQEWRVEVEADQRTAVDFDLK